MNAEPIITNIARVLNKYRLEAVMVGNAAAALHGAPVTTLDFDFMFRKTKSNLKKLKQIADEFHAVILKPYYPMSDLYRIVDENSTLQLDFMSCLHGVSSFAGLRSKAVKVDFSDYELWIADLGDIIESKKKTGRGKDKAIIPLLVKTYNEKKSQEK